MISLETFLRQQAVGHCGYLNKGIPCSKQCLRMWNIGSSLEKIGLDIDDKEGSPWNIKPSERISVLVMVLHFYKEIHCFYIIYTKKKLKGHWVFLISLLQKWEKSELNEEEEADHWASLPMALRAVTALEWEESIRAAPEGSLFSYLMDPSSLMGFTRKCHGGRLFLSLTDC